MRLWGGFLAENVTQATAACLLRELLFELEKDGFPVVGHVHDEVILEVLDMLAEEEAKSLQQYMEFVPEWADGLPLQAVPEIMKRYGK
jgi:DNA polymerase